MPTVKFKRKTGHFPEHVTQLEKLFREVEMLGLGGGDSRASVLKSFIGPVIKL